MSCFNSTGSSGTWGDGERWHTGQFQLEPVLLSLNLTRVEQMPFPREMPFSWTVLSFLTVSLSPTMPLILQDAFLISLFWWSLVTPSLASGHHVVPLHAPSGSSIGQNQDCPHYGSFCVSGPTGPPRNIHTSLAQDWHGSQGSSTLLVLPLNQSFLLPCGFPPG